MRKMDEMEKYHSGFAARIAFSFYTIVLLVWSLINYIQENDTGWQLSIALVGSSIYLWILVYYKRKVRNNK
ncbi:hypothetical protein ERICI_00878 [Paenibacillus larvae subsp. larvae]|uniref:Uncharacterized protein n=2 Tax=Paenibacillus larvae subsp. larvae TaxID=147375 RepID=V9W4S7_9BACL|nr:hypothetical protein ERIC2_c11130 [Paenibacillus larvae subsp. larvae DSM 25430]AQR78040.1 hypothetical protein BXP28_12630 [Paenibacillus larvae subsp. larvae]AQT85927.1 hypothetical protein B1222_18295 [Paenibacillus larvae subsp. pulvifaciens]ETK28243.1 hypothetical protein ERIC1_1c17050 [Paenibacillus larvae subsp. larvae DSM 25719]MBH0341361.1 hypothetical protein [Paenibacillus larvae]